MKYNTSYKSTRITVIFTFICIMVVLFILYKYYIKSNEKPIIPLHIYQTWHTKTLPPHMKICVDKLKKDNPEFTYHLYDDDDCREFIKSHFDTDILYAFDKLKPGAYKADLWRYCILYINGGIYLDIKYSCKNGFKLIDLTDKEYFVRDISIDDTKNKHGIYNAFLVCKPGNKILLKSIYKIVEHVNHKYYGNNSLDVTGPFLLNHYFTTYEIQNLKMELVFFDGTLCIKYNNNHILEIYKEYRNEQKKYQSTKYYGELWDNKDIYN